MYHNTDYATKNIYRSVYCVLYMPVHTTTVWTELIKVTSLTEQFHVQPIKNIICAASNKIISMKSASIKQLEWLEVLIGYVSGLWYGLYQVYGTDCIRFILRTVSGLWYGLYQVYGTYCITLLFLRTKFDLTPYQVEIVT
jgi:hypothetical protein